MMTKRNGARHTTLLPENGAPLPSPARTALPSCFLTEVWGERHGSILDDRWHFVAGDYPHERCEMSYLRALEAAGADVKDFQEFGSYQGEWWAVVEYRGQIGFVNGAYGSCSGCDAFEAEFGWDDNGHCDDHWSDEKQNGCEACAQKKTEHQQHLKNFGESYLENIIDFDAAIKEASKYIEFDTDAEKMVQWIQERAR